MPRAHILAPILGLALALMPSLAPAQARPDLAPLAERAPDHHEMLEAIGIYDILDIMAAEGIAQASEMEGNMFPGRGGDAWQAVVNRIHATDLMVERFEAAWPVDTMSAAEVATITRFAESDAGRAIFSGETAARQAFLDPDVEEAAIARFRERAQAEDPRLDILARFNAVNDLVERNVMAALNGNFTFYRGLSDGGAFEVEIPEELMLTEVWGQEAEIRADLVEWLYSYQLAAYADVSDAALETYVDLGETEAGAALNAALFTGFEALFDAMNYELGRAAGVFIRGEDT